jgi:hypothetical protein
MRKFELGRTVGSPGALEALEAAGQEPSFFLDKHVSGDWGSVDADDARANDAAIQTGGRLLSVYRTLLGVEVWVMTEATDDEGVRAATTVLLPEEY